MLEYQLQHGANEEAVIRQSAKSGQPLPARIENAPSLLIGLDLYYIGFQDLSSSRQVGMGLGPIPWMAIEQYCHLIGLDQDQKEAMHHHIVEMDSAFLKFHNKKKP